MEAPTVMYCTLYSALCTLHSVQYIKYIQNQDWM